MQCYQSAEKWFLPVSDLPIAEITIEQLQYCLDVCPCGRRTKENMKAVAGLLYKYAIPRRLATINLGKYLVINSSRPVQRIGLPVSALAVISRSVGIVPGADYILCQCYLGFRPSELLALDARDYNRTERAFTGGAKTAAGRNRIVTISPTIQPIIDGLIRGKTSGAVFCAADGRQLSLEQYREMFYSALDACGVENPIEDGRHRYTPHSCRHTFATLLKRVPGSDKDKLSLIGHSSTKMLYHYQDVHYEDLRRITDAL